MRILGIDPGTGICGFGVIENNQAIDYGVITTPPHTPLPDRLIDIHDSLHQIKNAICGYGMAHKPQVQEMVRVHLKLKTVPKPDDAADALAVAIVHSFAAKTT